jgi:hypothetical protein
LIGFVLTQKNDFSARLRRTWMDSNLTSPLSLGKVRFQPKSQLLRSFLNNRFVSAGGAVSLAFGGNLQSQTDQRQHIQQACTDPNSLSALIQSAMSKFQTHNIEFDIEVPFNFIIVVHVKVVINKQFSRTLHC